MPTALRLAFWTTLSFVLGAACSVIAGYVGMWISIRTNIRTASAARTSLNDALQIALRGGAVSGLFVVAMSLLGVGGLYWLVEPLHATVPPAQIPLLIVGYGFGASFVALFAQLGGGIYTKAADVGADLVGKVEAGIPEDDPRNPAVIADLVGDNVGDCAGRGADLFESTAAENIGAMILGATLAAALGTRGHGLRGRDRRRHALPARRPRLRPARLDRRHLRREARARTEDPMKALEPRLLRRRRPRDRRLLRRDAAGCSTTRRAPDAWWKFFLCGVIGVLTSVAFVYITQYYTEYKLPAGAGDRRGVADRARRRTSSRASRSASSARSLPVLAISAAILALLQARRARRCPGGGLFGTAVATMGMLGTAAYILAMDTFGPITDNAGGIVEMSRAARGDPQEDRPPRRRRQHDQGADQGLRDRLGRARRVPALLGLPRRGQELRRRRSTSVNLAKPEVFVGGLLGAMLVFFFSRARDPGRRQGGLASSSRRCGAQFKEQPGHHGRAPRSRTTAAASTSSRAGALQADGRARASLAVGTPIVGRPRLQATSRRSAPRRSPRS